MARVKLVFYAPLDAAEAVKQAVFNAGAGRIGNYEHCCWQTQGTGQFRPRTGAKPAIGALDQLCQVPELKVEMLCDTTELAGIIAALKAAHPYEEPAYNIMAVLDY